MGKFETEDELEIVYKKLENFNYEFETLVDRIYVEKIEVNKESVIEYEYLLK
nr:hypothetical protein [Miniphocaeibacter massiliensis]